MKKSIIVSLFALIFIFSFSLYPLHAQEEEMATDDQSATEEMAEPAADSSGELVIADFDTGDKPNNLGGDFGGWDKDPDDSTQGIEAVFFPDDGPGDPAGYSIQMKYDVRAYAPAYCGFWMQLGGLDASAYDTLNFYVKGDENGFFPKMIKVELKDGTRRSAPYLYSGITNQWQKISLPFKLFSKIRDWSKLEEFILVFDDVNTVPKVGTVYIDHVTLSHS